ncbi:MAG: terminase large subunit [Herbinix sp.]|nr:terminase large subunit [Herbinix sp.]
MIDLISGTYNKGIPCIDEHSWLLEYIGKCQRKEIIVGRELLQEFDILLTYFDNPDIRFELGDAHIRIKFIEEKCKLYEAPYDGEPFILQLFQKAFIENIYSFKMYDEEINKWVRLIQEVLFLVSRKNGKTPLISAICFAEFFCGEKGTKILCSSNNYEQADLAFQAMDAMREQSPSLERLTRKNIKGIHFGNPRKPIKHGKFSYENHGNIKKISAKTGAKEGKNIKVGMVDEAHELTDDSSIMPIRQALSTQNDPLFFELTTEGFVNDGYLDRRLKEARNVLDGEDDNPRWAIWLYTQDNETEIWQDENSWYKSNPGLGTIKKKSFIRKMLKEAKTNMATRAFVLSKDFNLKQNNSKAWLSPEIYVRKETFDIKELAGCYGIGAVDLAETTDLISARMMIMKPGYSYKYMIQQYFIPEAKLDCKDDGKDYREWKKQGLVTVSPGNDNDFSLITKWFVDRVKNDKIKPYKIGYDTALAKYWAKEMEDIFGDDCLEKVPQRREVLSSPMNLLEADLRSKSINYNANVIDEWCLSNIALDMDKRGLIMPVKVQGKREKRIDGGVTMIICETIFQQFKSEYLKYVGG